MLCLLRPLLCLLRPLSLHCQGKKRDYNLSISKLAEFLYVKKVISLSHWRVEPYLYTHMARSSLYISRNREQIVE